MRSLLTLALLTFSIFFVGCAESPTAPRSETKIEMKNVRVQMLLDNKPTQWQATFHISDMGTEVDQRKPKNDTASYNLGNFDVGSKVRIVNDTTLNLLQTSNFLSILFISGNDTVTTYGVEGLYTVYEVK